MSTSVSMLDWKIDPACSRRSRSSRALMRLPLWATAMGPSAYSTVNGWAFFTWESPAVE